MQPSREILERPPYVLQFIRSAVSLCSQHSRHGKKKAVHELIIHHYHRCICPIDAEQYRPHGMKLPIQQAIAFRPWNQTPPKPQISHINHA